MDALLIGVIVPLLCGCAVTYGRRPTLCPETESVYALTIYSNTDSDKVNDGKAEKILNTLMEERRFNAYDPILRIQYNTALKFFYVVELYNTNTPTVTPFSERMRSVPRVFGRHAEHGYSVECVSEGTNYMCLTSWPYPLEDAPVHVRTEPGGRQEMFRVARILTIDGDIVQLKGTVKLRRLDVREFASLVRESRKPPSADSQ